MKKAILLFLLTHSLLFAFAQNEGDNFFGSDIVHEIRLTFDQPAYWDTLIHWKEYANATGENVYITASAIVDGITYDSIGVRIKGNSSYSGYPGDKKPFKLKFDEYISGQKVDGMKKLTLNNGFNDPTMLREKLLLDYERKHDIAAPRCTYAEVYINNTYWGLYSIVEQVDKTFLGNHFPENDGNLFKGDPFGRLQWSGPAAFPYYNQYELKTNETANDWSDLIHLIDNINNTPTSDFKDSINAVFNTSNFLRNNAVNLLFVSLDSYVGQGHNYYVYHNLQTNQFEWITWDANSCFGVFNNNLTNAELKNLSLLYIKPPRADLPLVNNILDNEDLKTEYLNYVADFLMDDFDTTHIFPQIDSLADKIRSHLYADTKKMFTNNDFEGNLEYTVVSNGNKQIPALKDFLSARIPVVKAELEALGIDLSASVQAQVPLLPNAITVYPNPAQELLIIHSHTAPLLEVSGYNALGELVVLDNVNGNESHILSLNHLPDGLYWFHIQTEQGRVVQKVYIQRS